MLKLDLDKFWMLPRCGGTLRNGRGSYCAVGAFNEGCGVEQNYTTIEALIGREKTSYIYMTNDVGEIRAKISKRMQEMMKEGKKDYFRLRYGRRAMRITDGHRHPEPEKAKRMLLEAIQGKVEIVSKELSLDNLPALVD